MILIAHRRNTVADLKGTPRHLGIEMDVRSRGSRLVVTHDPFTGGPELEEWLSAYRHRLLIVNVKEEGLEEIILPLLADRGIAEFFFLDQSFPFLVRTARAGEPRCAVRVSEYESVETALTLAGMVRWVWVDCFTRFPLGQAEVRRLEAAGLSLCLVSPELQGRPAEAEIPAMRALCAEIGLRPAAVCTKRPDLWS